MTPPTTFIVIAPDIRTAGHYAEAFGINPRDRHTILANLETFAQHVAGRAGFGTEIYVVNSDSGSKLSRSVVAGGDEVWGFGQYTETRSTALDDPKNLFRLMKWLVPIMYSGATVEWIGFGESAPLPRNPAPYTPPGEQRPSLLRRLRGWS